MKYTYITIILSALVLLSCSCAPESAGNYSVPKFPPIKVNEHTVYIGNFDKTCVYAVDTLNNRIIYQYNFGDDKVGLYDLEYDYNLSSNFFVNLQNTKSYCVMINPLTGKSKVIDDKIYAEGCSIVGNKICFMADLYGTEYEHIFYDPSNDTIDHQTIINKTSIGSGVGRFYIELEDQEYFFLFHQYNGSQVKTQFFNSNTEEFIDNSIISYDLMPTNETGTIISSALNSNNYICSFFIHYPTFNEHSIIYKVNSLEPIELYKVYELDGAVYDFYETENYLILCDKANKNIIKLNKETKEVIGECIVEDFSDYIRYYRNGALWFADWSGKDRVRKLNIETMQISYVD